MDDERTTKKLYPAKKIACLPYFKIWEKAIFGISDERMSDYIQRDTANNIIYLFQLLGK